MGLTIADIVVIFLYFGGILGIGIWAGRKVKGEEDFLLGGRTFGKLIQTFASFGSGTHVENAVGVTTTTFTNGASGMWSAMLTLFATPVYWFTSVWMRRLRILTAGDFFEERYGSKAMAGVYALVGTLSLMAVMAVGFSAMSKTVAAIVPKNYAELSSAEMAEYQQAYELKKAAGPSATGKRVLSIGEIRERNSLEAQIQSGSLNPASSQRWQELKTGFPAKNFSRVKVSTLIWSVCIVTIIYTVAGGLEAAFLAEIVQGSFIILMSIFLIPFAWARINHLYGGSSPLDALRTIHERLPSSFFEIFGSPAAADFTWYYIVALSLMVTLSVVLQPNMLVTSGSAKDEYSARYGMVTGNFMKRFCTLLWGLFSLSAVVIYGGTISDPDLIWGHATRDLLGPLGIGLVGLMISCLMSALMATVSAFMLTNSGLLTQNVYRLFVPKASDSHYVLVSRILGVASVLGAAWIALQFETILQLLKFLWELTVMMVPAFWLGIKWRRANKVGAWASIAAGGLPFLLLPILVPALHPGLRYDESYLKFTEPSSITRSYQASAADVAQRQREIESWQVLPVASRPSAPIALNLGERFDRAFALERKPIFWTNGVALDSGRRLRGVGTLSLDLLLLDALGVKLTSNPYSVNETIRLVVRTFVPILVMFFVCLFTKPDPQPLLDRFFSKMRTPVNVDRLLDEAELAKSYADPGRFREKLMFPESKWEFFKWTKQDFWGFLFATGMVCVVLLTMQLIVSIGG